MSKLENLNNQKLFRMLAIAGIIYINILLIIIFSSYFQTKANLTNPLIPKQLIDISFEQNAVKGMILSSGLLILLVLKFAKQNFFTSIGSFILLLAYLFVDHSIDFSAM